MPKCKHEDKIKAVDELLKHAKGVFSSHTPEFVFGLICQAKAILEAVLIDNNERDYRDFVDNIDDGIDLMEEMP